MTNLSEKAKVYIGTKIIEAEPMMANAFRIKTAKPTLAEDKEGYIVCYPDGYTSWSPKAEFEFSYRQIREEEAAIVDERNP